MDGFDIMAPTLLIRGKLVGEGLGDLVPIDYILDWFRQRIRGRGMQNRVLILKSETASGKSTVIPPRLWGAKIGDPMRGMIVTQPRVVTAIENVSQIREHNPELTDRDIGYSTKYDKMRPARHGILSATIGTLTAELASATDAEIIRKYQYIIIDEAHERNIQLDMTLMALRNLLVRCADRDDCPFVVLGSATFDETVFLEFFGVPRAGNFIWCAGQNEPIAERWDRLGTHTTPDYIKTAAGIIADISAEDADPRSDIIVFLPGGGEIRALREALEPILVGVVRKNPDSGFDVVALESGIVKSYSQEYQRLFDRPVSDLRITVDGREYVPRRRVILATVVAETGLTLDSLKYTIDSGFLREVEYNPQVNASGLLTRPAPRSRIRQRRGRVGRKFPGVFYPLYPQYIYEKLPVNQYPEIITRSPFDQVLMTVAVEQYRGRDPVTATDPFQPTDTVLVDQPPAESLRVALHTCERIGLIRDGRITRLGEVAMRLLDIPPDCVRSILAGYYWGISPSDLIIANAYVRSFSSSKFEWSEIYKYAGIAEDPTECQRLRLLLADSWIDGVVLYRALNNGALRLFGEATLRASIAAFAETVDTDIGACTQAGLRVYTSISILDRLTADVVARFKHCIYDGFAPNLCRLADGTRTYVQNGWGRERVTIPPILADKEPNRMGVSIAFLPKYICAYRFEIKYNEHKYVHVLKAPHICVLDGYLSPDGC